MYQNLRIEWDYGDIPCECRETYSAIRIYVSGLAKQIDENLSFETKEEVLEYFRPYIESIQKCFSELSYDEEYYCCEYNADYSACTAEFATLRTDEILSDSGSDFLITFMVTYKEG